MRLVRLWPIALFLFSALPSRAVPFITRQPPEIFVDQLGTVSSLSVQAAGDTPVHYQWLRYVPPRPNDWRDEYIPLTGETNSSYTPWHLMRWRQFAVAVSDQSGSVTSLVSTISTPDRFTFQRISSWPPAGSSIPFRFADFVHKDETVLAAIRTNFVAIINVSDRFSPLSAGTFLNPGRAVAIERHGNFAAVACGTAGVDLLDIADPRKPSRLATAQFGANVWDVLMTTNRVYAVAASFPDAYLYPLDISNPAAPLISPAYRLPFPLAAIQHVPNSSQHLLVHGTLIFCIAAAGVRILDATDPAHIVQLGVYPGAISHISGIKNNLLFLAAGGIHHILDITSPSEPVLLNSFPTTGGGKLHGDLVISGLGQHIQISDVSTPSQPAMVGSFFVASPAGWFSSPISTAHVVLAGNDMFTIEAASRLVVYSHLTNAPVIVTEPADEHLYASDYGNDYHVDQPIKAQGMLPLSYQWFYGQSGDTNRPVQGETSSFLNNPTPEVPGRVEQQFWVRVSNAAGFADSRTVTLSWVPRLRALPGGRLQLVAATSSSWVLQSSSDLRAWQSHNSITVEGNRDVGTAEFSTRPPEEGASERRFFRMIAKPNL